jgi:hypothetical protein
LLSFLAAQERRAEIKALRYLDAAIVLSQKDAELLAGLGFTGSVLVESPPIEVAHVVPPVHQGKTVLFSGHFGRLENSGGAKWLIDRVWPDVLRQEPEARLVIAGSSPPKWLYDLGNEGVKITGWMSDLNEYYAGARVFAASLLSGAGVKLKVLEAMAHNVPVVATPVAADGIVDVIGSDCFVGISDDPTAFAKYLVVALQDDEICRRVASQAAQQMIQFRRLHRAGSVRYTAVRLLAYALSAVAEPVVARTLGPSQLISGMWANDRTTSGIDRPSTAGRTNSPVSAVSIVLARRRPKSSGSASAVSKRGCSSSCKSPNRFVIAHPPLIAQSSGG